MNTVASLAIATAVAAALVALIVGLHRAPSDDGESRTAPAGPLPTEAAGLVQLRRLSAAVRWLLLFLGIAFLLLWAASGSGRGDAHPLTGLSLLGGLFILLSVVRPAGDRADQPGTEES